MKKAFIVILLVVLMASIPFVAIADQTTENVDDSSIVNDAGSIIDLRVCQVSHNCFALIKRSLNTPVLISATNVIGGVSVKWEKVEGAEKYRVFRKVSGGSWEDLIDTASLNYTDKTVESGTKYTYTVRCINANGTKYTSSYDAKGKSVTYIAAPKLSSVANAVNGVSVKWASVNGTEKYRVFRRTENGSWKTVTTTDATSFVDTKAASGTKYYYTVRCVNADGTKYTSAYNTTGKAINYIAAPKISSVTNVVGGVTIKWGKVNGAVGYRVFRKSGSGSWGKIIDTTDVSYTDKTAKSGTKYSYTVRCINSDGTKYTSAYNTTGKAITYIAAPSVSVANTYQGVKVSWGKVTGAVKYRVFRKTGSGSWSKVADTSNTYYVDKNGTDGTKYYYTVRCINSDGSKYTSAYNTSGKSVTYKKLVLDSNVKEVHFKRDETDDKYVTIFFNPKGTDSYSIRFSVDNEVVSCKWTGKWENNNTSTKLCITPEESGTAYITITNTFNNETIKIKVTVEPKVSLTLPDMPLLLTDTSYGRTQMIRLTKVTYTVEKSYDNNYRVVISYEGEKVYDSQGSGQSRMLHIGYKLLDAEGFVVDSGTELTESVKQGDKFRGEWNLYQVAAGDYELQLLDTN